MNDSLATLEYAETRRPVVKRSVHEACRPHEDEFKWLESEKEQRDLGEEAIRKWVRFHWDGFLRARWVEHLEGKEFWIELDKNDFGLLDRKQYDCDDLIEPMFERLKSGEENLDLICWADRCRNMNDKLHQVLVTLDINRTRIPHRIDSQHPL